jgi:hypothetical protein
MDRRGRAVARFVSFAAVSAVAFGAGGSTLPVNERLDPVRPALERTVDEAAREGLPSELIVSKVREGLAKGVSPEGIRVAAERLVRNLADADHFLRARHRGGGSASLVRVLAEARSAGVDLEVVAPIIESDLPDAGLVHSVEVVTDLALRGYPSQRAAALVREVAVHDATSMARVVAGVEAIRSGQAVSRTDALEMLGRNLSTSGSFELALSRSLKK